MQSLKNIKILINIHLYYKYIHYSYIYFYIKMSNNKIIFIPNKSFFFNCIPLSILGHMLVRILIFF